MAVLDAHGRPIKVRQLTRPQAEPGITSVRQAWPQGVAAGLTPQRLAGILADCDQGNIEAFMTLAEEIEERDPHFASVMGQRKRAISGEAPVVTPVSESTADERIAAAVREKIAEHPKFPGLVEDLLDAVGKGFSVVEIDWKYSRTDWWPGRFTWRSQRLFQFDRETGTELRLRDEADLLDGIPPAPGKFLCHVAKLKSGHVFRAGVARVAAFSWMCKAYSLKDWMAFIEGYGLPIRLGRYGPQATKEEVAKLFTAVASIGTDAAAVLPRSMDIELVETKTGGASQPVFENLARYCDEQVSKLVLGQTMTTDDGSSMAQAKVHNDVRYDIAAADARSVSGTIQTDLVIPFVNLNFGPQKDYPVLSIDIEEPEDTKQRVESIVALAGAGVAFKAAQARAIVKMEDPEKGEEIFGGAPAAAPPQRGAREKTATARASDGHADELDEIEAEMLAEWEADLGPVIAPLLDRLEAAESYEEAMAILADPPDRRLGPLIDRLVKGMFKARSMGDMADD